MVRARAPLRFGVKVSQSRGLLKKREGEKLVETTASGKDGEMKAQGRKVEDKNEDNRERNRKKARYKKRVWWKRCRDFTKKIFKREEEER